MPSTSVVGELGDRRAGLVLVERDRLVAEEVDPAAHAPDPLARDQRLVVVVGGDVEAVGVGIAEVGLDARARAAGSSMPAVTIRPTRRPLRSSRRLSIAVPE